MKFNPEKFLAALVVMSVIATAVVATPISTINPSVPAQNSPLSSSVIRGNFQAAVNDINNLWIAVGSAASGGIYSIIGDATTGAVTLGTASLTLNTVNSAPGTYGAASSVGQVTVNGKGLVIAGTSVPISIPYSSLTGSVPTWNQNTTGNAATATALAALPSACSGGQFATGIMASGNAICGNPAGGVSSVFGRTGAVTAQSNDYAFSQLSGTVNLSSQASGTLQAAQAPAHTGDVTNTAGSLALTLATVNSNVGTYQGLTVNAKGLVTGATNQSYLTGNQNITLSGDLSGTGATAITGTLATVNSNTGSFGSSTSIPTLTVNGKGLVTAASGNAVVAPAGTLTGSSLASNVTSSSLTSFGSGIALGTPASGVATNLTGTASGLTAGTVSTINGLITNGSNVTITGSGTSGSPYTISSTGSGGGSPGGSNNQFQFNSSGSFAGSPQLVSTGTQSISVGTTGGNVTVVPLGTGFVTANAGILSSSTTGGAATTFQYNNGPSSLGGLTFSSNTYGNVMNELYQTANLLYQLFNGWVLDPYYYGAEFNTRYYSHNSYGAPTNGVTTTNGSPNIQIENLTCNPATSPAGDVGKRISVFGPCDPFQSGYVSACATTTTTNDTWVLGRGGSPMLARCSVPASTGQAVMGGAPQYPSTSPSAAIDDTIAIADAAADSAIYHGGKIILHSNFMIHDLSVASNVKLEGNAAGNNYGSNSGAPIQSATVGYVGCTTFADDADGTTPCDTGFNTANSTNVELTNVMLECAGFPYWGSGYSGQTTAAIGTITATDLNPEHFLFKHGSIFLCPVGFGMPVGYNQTVSFTGSISGTTLTVTSINSTNFSNYGASDFLAVGRQLSGTNIPSNEFITVGTQSGGIGTYGVSVGTSVSSETITSYPFTNYTSGTLEDVELNSDGIGYNGDFSDTKFLNVVTTGNYYFGGYCGPSGGSAGSAANVWIGGRDEEDKIGLGMDGCDDNVLTARVFQFNTAEGVHTYNATTHNLCIGCTFEGNNPSGSQIVLDGNGTDFTIQGTLGLEPNYAFGGNSAYLISTPSTSTFDHINVSGDIRQSYATALTNWGAGATPAHYRQQGDGVPFIDTTQTTMYVGTSGAVGLGTGAPESLLEAYNGEVQVGSSGASCAGVNGGAIRYSGGTLYYCNGSSWTSAGGGGSMVYPGAGIANSTGSAWGTSYTTTGSGTVLALAAGPSISGTLTLSGITGSTQCLHVNSSGAISGTGSDCGSSGGSVTTTGSPASSYLTAFSGSTSITGTASATLSGATLNLASASGVLQINGANAISMPSVDSTAGGSIAIGTAALSGISTSAAYHDTAIGYQAMNGAMTTAGINNSAVGYQALTALTSGYRNTIMGSLAADGLTSGYENTIIGYSAGLGVTGGSNDNTMVGAWTQKTYSATTSSNTGVGAYALQSNDGSSNTAVGYLALGQATNGGGNVAVGNSACNSVTGGANNICIGTGAGNGGAPTGGNNNIIIATNSGAAPPATSNSLNLGNLLLGVGLTTSGSTPGGEAAIGTASFSTSNELSVYGAQAIGQGYVNTAAPTNGLIVQGNVGIGTSNPGALFTVGGNSLEVNSSGQILINGSNGINFPSSDSTANGSIAVGSSSMASLPNSAAYANTAVGYQTLSVGTSTSAIQNSAFGFQALQNVTTGNNLVAFGYQAGQSDTTGFNNALFGWRSGSTITTGNYNDCFGHDACNHLTTASHEVAMGEGALFNDTSGQQTAIGYDSMLSNTTGVNNTAVGANSLSNNTTGQNNTVVGLSAGLTNVSGQSITAVGSQADEYNTNSGDTAIGFEALQNSTSGMNTALGMQSLVSLTSGSYNTAIGYNVGNGQLVTGSDNILIGTNNNISIGTTIFSGKMDIGNIIYGTGISHNGNGPLGQVMIGTATPYNGAAILTVAGTGASSTNWNASTFVLSDSTNYTYQMLFGVDKNANVGTMQCGQQGVGYLPCLLNPGGSAIGIGTTAVNPSNRLEVNGAATIGYPDILAPTNGMIVAGNIGIGTTSIRNSAALDVNGGLNVSGSGVYLSGVASSSSAQSGTLCYGTGGLITYDPSLGCLSSLAEYKTDIADYSGGLKTILALSPKTYFYKDKHDPEEQIGLIAQDVEKVDKKLVAYTTDGTMKLRGVRYTHLAVVDAEAIQEMQKEIDDLREQLRVASPHRNWFARLIEWLESL